MVRRVCSVLNAEWRRGLGTVGVGIRGKVGMELCR